MIPRRFIGENIVHLPTVKTHVFTTTTGAMKNAFGGLLNERRHWTHPVIHETLVDLLMIQQKIHRGVFAVMDGTFAGDGPGPRCMVPYTKNVILASSDQVAIDAVAAKLMGMDPLSIKFIRLAHDMGLGCGDPREIEMVGDLSAANENWHFDGPFRDMTFASRMQHKIYWGPLKKARRVVAQDGARAVGLHGERAVPRQLLVSGEGPHDDGAGARQRMGPPVPQLGEPHAHGERLSHRRRQHRADRTHGDEGVHAINRHPRHVHERGAGVRASAAPKVLPRRRDRCTGSGLQAAGLRPCPAPEPSLARRAPAAWSPQPGA